MDIINGLKENKEVFFDLDYVSKYYDTKKEKCIKILLNRKDKFPQSVVTAMFQYYGLTTNKLKAMEVAEGSSYGSLFGRGSF